MCYSAQIEAEYDKYVRKFGAIISIRDFMRLYWDRKQGAKIKIPKTMDASFASPKDDGERQIREMILAFDAEQASKLEQELFKQKKRLVDAERTLQTKPTKAATENRRIATDKIEWIKGKLIDLRRTQLTGEDSRIFPGWYAPVMVMGNGRRVIKPMRYQCRPSGKPAFNDVKFPGTYNARRDSLGSYWKDLFGYSHGLIIADAFYENVSRHAMEGRELGPGEKEENVILEFRPQTHDRMLVACLWSHWQGAGGRSCCPLRRSPMSRRRRWLLPVTIAASFRSRPRTSTTGSTRTRRISPGSMRSWMSASGHITSTAGRLRPTRHLGSV